MNSDIGTKIDRFAERLARKATRRMPDRCVVEVADAATSDKRGFAKTVYVPMPGEPLFCRMDGGLGREVIVDGRPTGVRQQKVSLVAIQDGKAIVIKEKDRLRVLARGARSEQLIDIEQVAEREGVMLQVFGSVITD